MSLGVRLLDDGESSVFGVYEECALSFNDSVKTTMSEIKMGDKFSHKGGGTFLADVDGVLMMSSLVLLLWLLLLLLIVLSAKSSG